MRPESERNKFASATSQRARAAYIERAGADGKKVLDILDAERKTRSVSSKFPSKRVCLMLSLLKKVESAVLGAIMIMASFGYAFVVFVRILLPKLAPALAWVEEASLFLVIVMVFLGLALGLEARAAYRHEQFIATSWRSFRRKIKIILDILGLAFSAYLQKKLVSTLQNSYPRVDRSVRHLEVNGLAISGNASRVRTIGAAISAGTVFGNESPHR